MENSQEKSNQSFPEMEQEVLNFWKKNEIFKKSVEKEAPQGNYVFYDGPPFITGLPHYGSLLPSIAKDVVPRYWTMKGYRVERGWGWDCHGLPAENRVEKQLGLKNKKDVEKLGVRKFIDACRNYVDIGSEQWKWYIDKIGRWSDMSNAYKTMDLNFMESVIWAFKELYDKNLIYEGYRTSLHCPRCATPLSKFEITMDAGSYRDVEDDAVTVKFKSENGFYFLAWTTTPWTLIGNLSLAVGEKINYVVVESLNQRYVLAKEKVKDFFEKKEYKIIKEIKGKDLIGIKYAPIFSLDNTTINDNKNVFKVYHGDFVDTQEGTGIVHIAPNFGEDDSELGKKIGLPVVEIMDENGVYTDQAGEWKNYYFKEANEKVLSVLEDSLFIKNKYKHSYPFCYRCDTELIYKTQKAWYLRIDEIREKMLEANEEINWVPEHFKHGRFKYNLENAPDWCLSRSRYWGSPVPVWKCEKKDQDCGNIKVIGSIKELKELSGKNIEDLHRPEIDEITFECEKCQGKMKRVVDVLDCWFESGSMPFAQFHYPYERKEEWKNIFPADFIIEYTGQLRGWFYYLHVLSNALFNSKSFRNVIVTGVLAGTDGRKMSKSFGNYPDPKMILEKYGGDALRLYFMSSPIMLGGDMNLSEEDIQNCFRKNVIILWNVVKFHDIFVVVDDFSVSEKEPDTENVLDKWILSRLNQSIKEITEKLEKYDLPSACQPIKDFISDLSTWYIRRSRNRFKGDDRKDAEKAIETTKYVLLEFSKAIAPIMPFISEQIWQKITNNNFKNDDRSVHLEKWVSQGEIEEEILQKMFDTRKIVEIGLAQRDEKKIKIRQPLKKIKITGYDVNKEYADLIKDELNVKEIEIDSNKKEIKVEIDFDITDELKLEGIKREIVRAINNIRKKKNLGIKDVIVIKYQTKSDDIKKVFCDDKNRKELLKETISQEITESVIENQEKININGNDLIVEIKKV